MFYDLITVHKAVEISTTVTSPIKCILNEFPHITLMLFPCTNFLIKYTFQKMKLTQMHTDLQPYILHIYQAKLYSINCRDSFTTEDHKTPKIIDSQLFCMFINFPRFYDLFDLTCIIYDGNLISMNAQFWAQPFIKFIKTGAHQR